jgi:methyl-accepting chemotaxis protein
MYARLTKHLANLSFAKKINLLTLPGLAIILAFAFLLIWQNFEKISDANVATKDARIATVLDNVAHNFAVERGITAGYLGSRGEKGLAKLKEQRLRADEAREGFEALYNELYATSSGKVQASMDLVKSSLEAVPAVRLKVNNLSSASGAFQAYSEINKNAINLIELVSIELRNPELIREMNALINVLWLKERAGQERGLLNGVFAKGSFTSEQATRSYAYESEQSARIDSLIRTLPELFQTQLEAINSSQAASRVKTYRVEFRQAVNQGGSPTISPGEWFSQSTSRIKDIKALSTLLISDIQEKTTRQYAVAMTTLVLELFITLLIIAAIFATSALIKKQLSQSILSLTKGFTYIRENTDFSYRIETDSEDELGKASQSFNRLMEQLDRVIVQVNQSLSAMARGDFSNKIDISLEGDLLTLKNGVNQSIDKVQFTMSELEGVMSALEQGNFEARMSNEIEGQFREKVDTAMKTLDEAMNEVSQVVVSMSQGDFTSRVNLPLNGSLDTLKENINSSATIVEGAISEISTVISTQSEGDFGVRVTGEYSGQLAVLKQTINQSITGIDDAVSDINKVFEGLARGEFYLRINSDLKGDLNKMKQGINSTLDKVSQAINEILEVTKGQSLGLLDKEVTGDYLGQLDDLKQSANNAGATIRSVVDAISSSMTMMNNGDFSSRIEAQMGGRYSELKSDFNMSMDALSEVISEIKNVSSAQSEGDLSLRIRDGYKGELKDIGESINASLDRVSSIVAQIKSSGMNTLSMAQEQSRAANSISKRTESQACSLEQIAATTEELASSVQQTSKELEGMGAQVTKVKGASHSCQESIALTVSKMDAIRESSTNMETFTNLIDEISFQTNLLALNAAVESARAGEHGRGFGVVAAEVRNLAQRSAQAAKEIKTLITENISIVDEGFEAINSSSNQIKAISVAIDESDQLIRNINNAGAEQARGLGELNSAITQLDSDTQQNSALVDNTSVSARSVEQQVFQVNESLNFFNAANQASPLPEEQSG